MIEILVIDDEQSVADALKMILEDCGYRVRSAATGREGVALAQIYPVAVTITDYGLPDLTGIEVIKAVSRSNPYSSVILMTAHSTPELVEQARTNGAFKVLKKPFSPSEIITLLEDVLARGARRPEACA